MKRHWKRLIAATMVSLIVLGMMGSVAVFAEKEFEIDWTRRVGIPAELIESAMREAEQTKQQAEQEKADIRAENAARIKALEDQINELQKKLDDAAGVTLTEKAELQTTIDQLKALLSETEEALQAAKDNAAADVKAAEEKAEAAVQVAKDEAAAAVKAAEDKATEALKTAEEKTAAVKAAEEKAAADVQAAKDEAAAAVQAAKDEAAAVVKAAEDKAAEAVQAAEDKAAELQAALDTAKADAEAALKEAEEQAAALQNQLNNVKADAETSAKTVVALQNELNTTKADAEAAVKAAEDKVASLQSALDTSKEAEKKAVEEKATALETAKAAEEKAAAAVQAAQDEAAAAEQAAAKREADLEKQIDALNEQITALQASLQEAATVDWPKQADATILVIWTESAWANGELTDAVERANSTVGYTGMFGSVTASKAESLHYLTAYIDQVKNGQVAIDAIYLFPYEGVDYSEALKAAAQNGIAVHVFESENPADVFDEICTLYDCVAGNPYRWPKQADATILVIWTESAGANGDLTDAVEQANSTVGYTGRIGSVTASKADSLHYLTAYIDQVKNGQVAIDAIYLFPYEGVDYSEALKAAAESKIAVYMFTSEEPADVFDEICKLYDVNAKNPYR